MKIGDTLPEANVRRILDRQVGSRFPGVQYTVIDADRIVFDYATGCADIKNQRRMKAETTLMAYSMTKTFTAVAIMQLMEQRKLRLDDEIERYLNAYSGHGIKIRQLITRRASPIRFLSDGCI